MPKLHCKPYLATGSFALAIALSLPAAGQNSTAPAANSNAPSQDQSVETLKVNVEVVQLFFNVKDKHGALIPNLNKENFDLFEDGQPQTIKYFKAESDLPLTLVIQFCHLLLDIHGQLLHHDFCLASFDRGVEVELLDFQLVLQLGDLSLDRRAALRGFEV